MEKNNNLYSRKQCKLIPNPINTATNRTINTVPKQIKDVNNMLIDLQQSISELATVLLFFIPMALLILLLIYLYYLDIKDFIENEVASNE